MKPRELYSGQAPAAMAQMGQGISEVGANIGRIMQQGYQQAGQAIGQGLQAVGQAYGDYKKMGSEIKASEGFYKSMKEGGYLPENMQTEIDATINSDAFKNSSTSDKAAYWNNIKSFAGQSIAHKWSMDKISSEAEALSGLRKAQEKKLNAETNVLERKNVAVPGFDPTGGGSVMDQPMDSKAPAPGLDSGSGINNGQLPTDPISGGMTESLLIPANYLDQLPSTQKKTRPRY
jgi:hypothetical protein